MDDTPIDTLARTIWGEARGTGGDGMRRVAAVIMNRVAHPGWWGHDISSVCLAPWQFSCRNLGDPNLPKLLAVDETDPTFRLAVAIATTAAAGKLVDLTNGADSYYANTVPVAPSWAAPPAVKTADDGWHSFYRTRKSP